MEQQNRASLVVLARALFVLLGFILVFILIVSTIGGLVPFVIPSFFALLLLFNVDRKVRIWANPQLAEKLKHRFSLCAFLIAVIVGLVLVTSSYREHEEASRAAAQQERWKKEMQQSMETALMKAALQVRGSTSPRGLKAPAAEEPGGLRFLQEGIELRPQHDGLTEDESSAEDVFFGPVTPRPAPPHAKSASTVE